MIVDRICRHPVRLHRPNSGAEPVQHNNPNNNNCSTHQQPHPSFKGKGVIGFGLATASQQPQGLRFDIPRDLEYPDEFYPVKSVGCSEPHPDANGPNVALLMILPRHPLNRIKLI